MSKNNDWEEQGWEERFRYIFEGANTTDGSAISSKNISDMIAWLKPNAIQPQRQQVIDEVMNYMKKYKIVGIDARSNGYRQVIDDLINILTDMRDGK